MEHSDATLIKAKINAKIQELNSYKHKICILDATTSLIIDGQIGILRELLKEL